MKKQFSIFLLFICCISCTYSSDTIQVIDLRERWDMERVLNNPHKGWYHHIIDNKFHQYGISDKNTFLSFPGMDHLYIKVCWSHLEPEEGKFNWETIDRIAEEFVPLGYGIALRVTTRDVDSATTINGQEKNGVQYATPVWVEEAGCKGTITEHEDILSWGPIWDDPIFLQKLENFHKAFAGKYDGLSWIRYIDIGTIGEWGEGHTTFTTCIPPTVHEVKTHIDLFRKHYKKTLLVAGDDLLYFGKPEGEVMELYEYTIQNDITIRDDSPLVDYYIERYPFSGSISNPEFYDPLYKTKPTILEMQHYSMVKADGNWKGANGEDIIHPPGISGAGILRKAIETMHATYIGYHGYAEEWLRENPVLTQELTNKCGYWYFPVKVSIKKILSKGENQLTISWLNQGVAPAYTTYDLILRLENKKNGQIIELNTGDSNNRNWLPGKEYEELYVFHLSSEMPPGTYKVSFGLKSGSIPVELGVKESDSPFVYIGAIKLI